MWQWLIPWGLSPTAVIMLVAAAILYVRGSNIIKPTIWQQICFWFGLLSIYLAWQTRFDYYAEHEFFMGRIQHAMLQHVGTFLMALAAPATLWYAGLPSKLQGCCCSYLQPAIWLQHLRRFFGQPMTAVLLFSGVIIIWLIPNIHFIAMLDARLYILMNISMVVSGFAFWHVVFNVPIKLGMRIVMLLAVVPVQIVIGVVLTFAPHDFYPIYRICGRAIAGLTPLQDQQIGGLIIWLHGAMMSIIGILIVLIRASKSSAAQQTY